jgi:hypothetical protein
MTEPYIGPIQHVESQTVECWCRHCVWWKERTEAAMRAAYDAEKARADKAEAALDTAIGRAADIMKERNAARADAKALAEALGMTECLSPMGEEGTGMLCARCAALAAHEALTGGDADGLRRGGG